MRIAGMIIEYNPMHQGHAYLIRRTRELLGADTAVVGVMSGNFVQRGDFALLRKHVRARAAVESGMDLVLELPLPWAVSSAERFADGGIRLLDAAGVVTDLVFGSESGDVDAIQRVAAALLDPAVSGRLQTELRRGDSFAAARMRAVDPLLSPSDARLLQDPNHILGIEYCKALLRCRSQMTPHTVQRVGMSHHGTDIADGYPAAGMIRKALRAGWRDWAVAQMTPAMAALYAAEEAGGRAPVWLETAERAVLSQLRRMDADAFARLDDGREGFYHRLYEASRTAVSWEELLQTAKTKRYALSRIRRTLLWAYLGLQPSDFLEQPPYLRVLAANAAGRRVLAQMRRAAGVPILTKPADVRSLSPQAQHLFSLEVRATDLYALAYPRLDGAVGGGEWREGPAMIP